MAPDPVSLDQFTNVKTGSFDFAGYREALSRASLSAAVDEMLAAADSLAPRVSTFEERMAVCRNGARASVVADPTMRSLDPASQYFLVEALAECFGNEMPGGKEQLSVLEDGRIQIAVPVSNDPAEINCALVIARGLKMSAGWHLASRSESDAGNALLVGYVNPPLRFRAA